MRGVTEYTASMNAFCQFQLTRLMRGVTVAVDFLLCKPCEFQLTRLMRGVTPAMSGFLIPI